MNSAYAAMLVVGLFVLLTACTMVAEGKARRRNADNGEQDKWDQQAELEAQNAIR